MNRRLLSFIAGAALTLSLAGAARAQDTPTTTTVTTQTTKTFQNADGTWTVIQYPADKEVVVNLMPGTTMSNGKGMARVMRHGDRTRINLDLSGLPADASTVNVYAVDPAGKFTLHGPVTLDSGVATQSFETPLDRFMLVLSPNAGLSSWTANDIMFRSAVPEGLAVVPYAQTGSETLRAVGERVGNTATTTTTMTPGGTMMTTTTSAYNVPMLGIAGLKRGEDTQVKVNLAGEMTGSRVNFRVLPRKDGPTMIEARFHELKDAPAGKRYVLWAVSPDNHFVKLGQIVNTGNRNEAEIKSEVNLPEFGLLITTEDADERPTGPVVGTIIR
jgi:hypothetical protein